MSIEPLGRLTYLGVTLRIYAANAFLKATIPLESPRRLLFLLVFLPCHPCPFCKPSEAVGILADGTTHHVIRMPRLPSIVSRCAPLRLVV